MARPFEKEIVLPRLKELNRDIGAVTARLLAELNGWSERSTRYWLARLEQAGMVVRPRGERSGWRVV